jgi:hypothetical protein
MATTTLSSSDRMTMLSRHIDQSARLGYRVIGQVDPFTVDLRAVRPMPPRPNLLGHLLLCMFSCGLWIFGWAITQGIWANQVQSWRHNPYHGPIWRLRTMEDGAPSYQVCN